MMAGNKKIQVDIVANDESSNVYNRVAKNTQSMAQKVNGAILSMNSTLRSYNNAMSTFNRGTQIALAGTGYLLYKFTKDSIKQFADFERQHGKTMGAMASNYEKTAKAQRQFYDDQTRLKQDALKLGTVGPTGKGALYNPTEVAYAQTALVKAGVDPAKISKANAVPQILKFAGGNDLPIEQATEYAVNVAQQFGIPMEKWGDMLDKITRAADISTIDVPDVFESLKYTGGIAAGLKRPLEEVLGMMSVMGNAGLKGSMSGTGIQAFFTRILSPIGKSEKALDTAPTEFSRQALEAFVASTTDANGKFLDMPTVTENLDKVMAELNDKEQAWFAQKLFGLFQMKAAYSLKNSGGSNLQSVINDINKNAPGTNDRKWDIMLETSWGKSTALKNAWAGIKTDVGYRLAPFTNTIADELFRVMTDKSNYKIDFTKLKKALKESSDMISQQYGNQIGSFVNNAGNFGINAVRTGYANEPLLEGMAESLAKLFSGDLSGSIDAMGDGIERTNQRIHELPPELQGMATQVRNVILALSALAGINFAAKLVQNLSTLWKYSFGKIIGTNKTAVMNTTATTMTVTAATVIVNGGVGGGAVSKGGKSTGGGGTGVLGGTEGGTKNKNPIDPSTGKPYKGRPPKDGFPTETTPPASTPSTGIWGKMKGKIGKGVGIGSWIYALSEMFGINDNILDSLGATEGTGARDAIDTGRNILNWGLTASFLDKLLLKGAGGKAIVGAVTSAMTSTGLGIMGGLPLALEAPILLDAYHKQKLGREVSNSIDSANARKAAGENVYWGWDDNMKQSPFAWLFGYKNPIMTVNMDDIDKRNKALAKAREDNKYKYNYGDTQDSIGAAPPSKSLGDFLFPGDYMKKYAEYAKAVAEGKKFRQEDERIFKKAQELYYTRNGQMLSFSDYASNRDKWKNDPEMPKGFFSTILSSMTPTVSSGVTQGLQSVISAMGLGTQQSPTNITLAPNVDVHVTVDQNGNVLDKKTYIGNMDGIDKALGIFGSRNGGLGVGVGLGMSAILGK
jgi:TP901 family phage tail tape measure protein